VGVGRQGIGYEVFHGFNDLCNRPSTICPLPEVMEECQPVQVMQCFDNADGTQRYDEITMSPFCAAEGTEKRVIEVIKDITPCKQLEKARQGSEEQIRLFRSGIRALCGLRHRPGS
jgi:hypothetical protein